MNETGIVDEKRRGNLTILEVDVNKAKYRGRLFKDMGGFGKLKFENWLVISRSKEMVKVFYTNAGYYLHPQIKYR